MPVKKTTSLADILKNKEEDKQDVTNTPDPEVTESETTEPDPVVEDDDEVIVSPDDENGPFANPSTSSGNPILIDRPGISKPVANDNPAIVPEGTDHVHTWEENHDHNLGRLHPDVATKPLPSEYAQVSGTVIGIDYANPAELDDKFPMGREGVNGDDE